MSEENQKIQVIPAEAINERFDKIEAKIDKLSDAMISLARTEEKMMAMEIDRKNTTERLNRHSEKLDELNDKVNDNSRVTANIVKITWMVVAGLAAGLAKMFSGQ
jgi:predicted  nucleic acid-binding Zn-ribbon protein